jgi:hypothetical protein
MFTISSGDKRTLFAPVTIPKYSPSSSPLRNTLRTDCSAPYETVWMQRRQMKNSRATELLGMYVFFGPNQ